MSSHCLNGDNLNKMDNKGYEREGDRRSTVELGAVIPPQEPHVVLTPTPALNGNGRALNGCSDHCLKLHQQHKMANQPHTDNTMQKPSAESPWHHLKTIFLVGTIVFLALWILIYTLLSQLNLL